jgi:hypothetical protein
MMQFSAKGKYQQKMILQLGMVRVGVGIFRQVCQKSLIKIA